MVLFFVFHSVCTTFAARNYTLTIMKKYALAALALLGMAACSDKKFHVEGAISDAKDQVLYFENVGLNGIEVLDSAKLGEDGTFDFSGEGVAAPEFYRLRIKDQIINVAIDSTETIGIKAQWPSMASDYEVTGSDNNLKIKELALMQQALLRQAMALEADNTLPAQVRQDSLRTLINGYKERVKTDYIFREPNQSYAYFALFQTLGPWLIFDPKSNRDDIKVFAAVATSWDTYFPGAERGENLHNIAIEGLKNSRIIQQKQAQQLEPAKVVESGIIDITLTDNHGNRRSLSDLEGQVVLLDFHVFSMEDSPRRILALRDLYNKYHTRGFEIYQVALDPDEHFWKQTTAALPWVSVRDEEGPNSRTLQTYNVQSLPEYFLIDRQNNLYKRSQQIKDLDAEIAALL